jgi:cbb3-type cytochrome oxidase maturation protein
VNILFLMIPLSLLFLGGALAAFFWAVNHGQFDDLDTPGLLPLLDRTDGSQSGNEKELP